jgi:hypothetical protein
MQSNRMKSSSPPPSSFITVRTPTIYALRMNRTRIVILNAILLLSLLIGGLNLCRTHFS